MNLAKKLLTKLNGLHYRQDYLCFAHETFSQPLHLYLSSDGKVIKDITYHHAFVGYCPVIFALPSMPEVDLPEAIHFIFSHDLLTSNQCYDVSQLQASLRLKRIKVQHTVSGSIFYYQAFEGRHQFTSLLHQSIELLNNRLHNKKDGNVFLRGNLFKQVQIAYSLPRKICLITVAGDEGFNLFPTDLHGQIFNGLYMISLRHTGKACEQVMQAERIVLSDVHSSAYKTVFNLGKNHMQPLRPLDAFDFSDKESATYHIPIPAVAMHYKELRLIDFYDAGIHRLLLFKIISSNSLSNEPYTLVHIHNAYATWRYKKGLEGNYLFR